MEQNNILTERAQQAFGKRVGAALIDFILWVILFFVATATIGSSKTVVQNHQTSTQVSLTGAPLLVFMLLQLSYFVFLEWRMGGTLGKLLLGVRVVNTDSGQLTFKQSFIRNILRIVDAFPYIFPYLAGLIVAVSNPHKQRVGDKLAQTFVVNK